MIGKLRTFSITIFILLILFFTKTDAQESYKGFTFYASGNNCYLYNSDDEEIHKWTSEYRVMSNAYLLRDSSVFFPCVNPKGWNSGGAQTGGRLQIIKWNGDLAWDFQYCSSTYCPHHDAEPVYRTDDPKEVPNVLVICYERVSGFNSNSDKIVEFKPTGRTTGEIVWEWHAYDHSTNDGNDKPELLDLSAGGRADWTHINNVSYNRDLDQIAFGVKSFYEIMIIDHSTTTEEAAGSTGGKYGKGGDILYRWGNPGNYGISGSKQLSGFHCGRWIPKKFPGSDLDVPGGGNLILAHNDKREVVEIKPSGIGDGIYPRDPGSAFGPASATWTNPVSQMGGHQGSVQRLPNGNTLICTANRSIIEITNTGQSVWNMSASCSKATRYAPSYFDYVTDAKDKNGSLPQNSSLRIYSNPLTGKTHIHFNNPAGNTKVRIFSLNGKEVISKTVIRNHFELDVKNLSSGVYIVRIQNRDKILSNYINLIN